MKLQLVLSVLVLINYWEHEVSTSELIDERMLSKRSVFDLIPEDRGQMRMLWLSLGNARIRMENRKEWRMRKKNQLRILFKRWMKRSEKIHILLFIM